MMNRRQFLQSSTLACSALALPRSTNAVENAAMTDKAKKPLNILILGGTGFLGPHTVEYALARGHTITLFNRGKTNPHLFPTLEKLRGDRKKGDLQTLADAVAGGRKWDVVIDPSAYYPRAINEAMDILEDHIGFYQLVSSISVYSDNSIVGMDESGPLGTIDDQTTEEITGGSYGPLKVLCEQAAEKHLPGRVNVVRPGLIVGPLDATDRFTYWPIRIERGGEVMAPGNPTDPVQFIDVRDLAQWMIHLVEQKTAGIFNANGPNSPTNIAELLYGCKAVTGGDARFTWVDADFLEEHQIAAWSAMPVWIPPSEGYEGFHRVSCAKAIKNGLNCRPLAETVHDTLDWFHKNRTGKKARLRSGIAPDREVAVLKAWHERNPVVTTRPGAP